MDLTEKAVKALTKKLERTTLVEEYIKWSVDVSMHDRYIWQFKYLDKKYTWSYYFDSGKISEGVENIKPKKIL